MFYNTGISTHVWLLTNRKKAPARKDRLQLINGVDRFRKTRGRYRFVGADAPYFMTMPVNSRLHGSVVPEDHLHLIAGSPQIGTDVQRFKSYTARRIIDYLEAARAHRLLDLLGRFKRAHKTQSEHQFSEEGSHPQRIESEGVMRQKLEYIHYNPVKRGFVDLPEHWRWSSSRDDAGLAGLIEVDREW